MPRADAREPGMRGWGIKLWTGAVAIAAAASTAALPAAGLLDRWPLLLGVAVLAALAGGRAVRVPGLRVQVTVSDLYVFCSLFVLPPMAVPLVAFAGTAASVFGPDRRRLSLRTLFNLAAVPLSAASAAGTLAVLAGGPGASRATVFAGGLVAAGAYHAVNVALVAMSILLETGRSLWATFHAVGPWTAVACLASVVAGSGLAFAVEGIGVLGLVPGLSVTLPLAAFVEKVGAARAA